MTPVTEVVPGMIAPIVCILRNVSFAENQPEYATLPAWRDEYGTVVTRWRGNWKERLKFLLTGDMWLSILTFNGPLQPVKLETECPVKPDEE